MKNVYTFSTVIMSFCLSLLLGCKTDDDTPPPDPLTISGIFPNSNPIGGPILIEGEGFTTQTEVYFNNIGATIEERSATFLTTKVPAGIGLGSKTVRIEDGNRLGTVSFDVLAQFPSDLPVSPPSIIIPVTGLVSPIFISEDAPCYYSLRNVYNTDHRMRMSTNDWLEIEDCNIICEFSEKISDQKFPLRNKWKDEVMECEVDNNLVLELEWIRVDRSESSYQSDSFTGIFFSDENFELPDGFEPPDNDWESITDNFLLLTSEMTGRQYLFVITIYGF